MTRHLMTFFLIFASLFVFVNCDNPSSIQKWTRIAQFAISLSWPFKDELSARISDKLRVADHLVSDKCSLALRSYSSGLLNNEKWALKMLDASAKIRPGFIAGEYTDFGHFYQCLSTKAVGHDFGGKNFLVRTHWPLPDRNVREIDNSGKMRNSSHWVDTIRKIHKFMYFETFISALCLPSDCESHEVEHVLQRLERGTKLDMSSYESKSDFSLKGFSWAIAIILVSTTLYATFMSYYHPGKVSRTMSYFNAIQNSSEIMNVETSNKDAARLHYINGVRMIYSISNFLTHFVFDTSQYSKPTHMRYVTFIKSSTPVETAISEVAATLIGINFVMGGLVHYYASSFKLKSGGGKLAFGNYVTSRVLRSLPVLIAIMLIVFAFPSGTGPMFETSKTDAIERCRNTWWYELIMSSHYPSSMQSCIPHGFYMSVDMRFYVSSFFILPLMYSRSTFAMALLLGAIPVGMVAQGYNIWAHNVPALQSASTVDLQSYYDVEKIVHVPTLNYISSYAIGLLVGYLVVNKIERFTTRLGYRAAWTFAWALHGFAYLMPFLFDRTDRTQEILLGATLRTVVSASFGLMCYLAWIDGSSLFIKFLSCRLFRVLGKISYSTFMIHFIFIYYENFTLHEPIEYRTVLLLHRWFHTTVVSFVLGYLLYIFVEAPFAKITRQLLIPAKKA